MSLWNYFRFWAQQIGIVILSNLGNERMIYLYFTFLDLLKKEINEVQKTEGWEVCTLHWCRRWLPWGWRICLRIIANIKADFCISIVKLSGSATPAATIQSQYCHMLHLLLQDIYYYVFFTFFYIENRLTSWLQTNFPFLEETILWHIDLT